MSMKSAAVKSAAMETAARKAAVKSAATAAAVTAATAAGQRGGRLSHAKAANASSATIDFRIMVLSTSWKKSLPEA